MLQVGMSRIRFEIKPFYFFFSIYLILPALGLTQSLTEMSIKNVPEE
jgi:hypothetical protein